MNRSKKIFLVISGIFLIVMIIIGYDISRRTTFPGQKDRFENANNESVKPSKDSLDTSTDKEKR